MTEPDARSLSPPPPPPPPPRDRLREAFRHHGTSTQQAWAVKVTPLRHAPGTPETYCISIELTSTDVDALVDVLHGAAELGTDSGRRGPNWAWIDSNQVAEIVGVKPGTIRAWIATKRPRGHPFPRPGRRLPGRNLWRPRVIEKWKNEHGALDSQGQEDGDQTGNPDS